MQIYLHIPFCDSKCFYCSFNSYTNLSHYIDSYFKALLRGLEYEIKRANLQKNCVSSIFIGGGTPSTADAKYYEPIFKLLEPFLQKECEITIEANPNSATKSWLKDIFSLGVNRVSFGVQSFNDKKLKLLNRAHSSKEATKAIIDANKVGFKNISLDIIYDFYLDTKELLKKDLDIAFSLPINHISAYELTIEKATKFFNQSGVKKDSIELNYFICDEITKRGFLQYEVSNYGTYKSQHNLGYWKHNNYLGVGAGAVGFLNGVRYYCQSNIANYIKNPFKYRFEHLTKEDILTEKIFLGLRSIVGIDQKILPKDMQKRADILVAEERLTFKNGVYFNKEFFLSDELALFIMQN